MNGPEHYRHAEGALEALRETPDPVTKQTLVGVAQVHATLALAAAFVAPTAHDEHDELIPGWLEVIR